MVSAFAPRSDISRRPDGELVCSALERDATGALSFVPPVEGLPSAAFKMIKHVKNRGKGGAIRTRLASVFTRLLSIIMAGPMTSVRR
jgi:hypothetical protein